jgi:hypothetical protein
VTFTPLPYWGKQQTFVLRTADIRLTRNERNYFHGTNGNKYLPHNMYCVCIAGVTLDAELLARSQYPAGPATGHLDAGFLGFPVKANAEMAPKTPKLPLRASHVALLT